jgi:hypothetical protein
MTPGAMNSVKEARFVPYTGSSNTTGNEAFG